jgi:DNA-binding response OmpR family regulator
MRLLLVEDDPLLGDGIATGLRQDGYALDWVRNGEQGWQALVTQEFDLAILDLGLPGMDGLDLLRKLRERKQGIPVLVLTARDSVADRVRGLDTGCDDYMVKPFDLDELSARVRALLRRGQGRASPQLQEGDLVLDPAAHQVTYRGAAVELSPREFTLLQELLENAGRVVSRARLQESLYGWDQSIESNAVEVYVHHLRRKLDADLIHTVRGVGYLLRSPSAP